MELTPFSWAVAEEICEDFEDLVDTEFSVSSSSYIIDAVVIAPHESEVKAAFFEAYLKDNTTLASGGEYDVLLIVCDATDEEVKSYMSIGQYITEQGIHYNFPSE